MVFVTINGRFLGSFTRLLLNDPGSDKNEKRYCVFGLHKKTIHHDEKQMFENRVQ